VTEFVGVNRQAILERLVTLHDDVAAGAGPRAVSLEASLGLGKTRIIQELFRHLAASRQGPVPYWPAALDWEAHADDGVRRDVLQARKQVEPTPGWVVPGGVEIPWLWWGIGCQLSKAGSPMRALKDASDQLRVHLDPMLEKLSRSSRNRDDAFEVISGLFDLAGVVAPGSAIDAGSKFFGVFRRRVQDKRRADVVAMDRRIDTHGDSYAEAARIAEGLTAIARARTPVVLVVDDAQWADPALVSLLRHLVGLDAAPILIVTTAWPDKLADPRSATGSFAAWLEGTALADEQRLERIALAPLDPNELGEIVLGAARRTPPATVQRIAATASGNPLVLNLLLDLEIVRRDIAADGSIDIDPAELARLPSNLRVIYQDLWRQLPDAVQRTLALAAVQGPEFLPGFVADAAARLGMFDELMPAFDAARDVHRWIRPVNEDRYEFVERQRFDIADDLLSEIYGEQAHRTILASIVAESLRVKASERWPDLDIRSRRLVLESHLDANEGLGAAAERDLGALADSMRQLALLELGAGEPGRAVELAERSLELLARGPGDPEVERQTREVLAQALTEAVRAEEAVGVLGSLLSTGSGVTSEEAVGVAALLAEAQAEATLVADPLAAAGARSRSSAVQPPGGHGPDAHGRQPWVGWTPRPLPSLTTLAPSEVGQILVEVVAIEGPVYAARVYDLARAASGAARLGAPIRAALDSGVRSAVRRGHLVASVPDSGGDSGRRVLRTPSQPEVVLRELGDRTVDLVPPGEIAELGRSLLRQEPGLTRDQLKRQLLPLVGAANLGVAVDRILEAALPPTFGVEVLAPETDAWGRLPWVGWAPREIGLITGLRPSEVATLILEVVSIEGPVQIGRVFELLRESSGAARMSKSLHDVFDGGVASAVRQGRLVVMRGRRGDPDSRTLRLPEQPEVILRLPGERDVSTIPPSELAELARRVRERTPDATRDDPKRQVGRLLGWGRHTAALDALLESALPDPL
jgi:hypothetical protein